MKIAIIGATGYTGAPLLTEALDRGHTVTAIVRHPEKLPTHPALTSVRADARETDLLVTLVAGHDVLLSAFNPGKDESDEGVPSIIEAAKRAKVPRLVVIGGAGTLEIAPGRLLVDEPDFPAAWKAGALKTAAFLKALRAEADLDWTFVSPAAQLSPGERTGRYRLGSNEILTDVNGDSRISTADLAVAMLDEVEHPAHHRVRFSVAY